MKLIIIHAPGVEIDIQKESSIYAPRDSIYLMPNQDSFEHFVKSMYQLEKEKNEWIRSYDNVLRGLRYWKSKALESPDL